MSFFTFAKSVILLTSFGYFTNGFYTTTSPSRTCRIFGNPTPQESNDVPRNSQKADLKTLGRAISIVAAGLTAGSFSAIASSAAADIKPKISLEPLPYDYKSLSPYISDKTLMTHHDKHHAKYVSTTVTAPSPTFTSRGLPPVWQRASFGEGNPALAAKVHSM